MNRRCSGRQPRVQKPVTHELPRRSTKYAQMTRVRRQATVESESLSEICGLVPEAKAGVLSEECGSVKESQGADTRSCASTRPARW